MIRHLTIFLFCIIYFNVFGQEFTYPTIKSEGTLLNDFIPSGWIKLDSAFGDLNNDTKNDFALVIQKNENLISIKTEDDYSDTMVSKPRILIILLKDSLTGKFRLFEQSNSFILCDDTPQMSDPFEGVTIEKGILIIDFRLFYNIGSWYATTSKYKFKIKNDAFTLIGADCYTFHRGTQDFTENSYNFLTKKWKSTKGNFNSEKKPITEWKTLELKELKTFKSFTKPFTWEVTKNEFL